MTHLTREQTKALNVVLEHLPVLYMVPPANNRLHPDAPLLPTNFMASSCCPIPNANLPRGVDWHWNQSNAKITVTIDDQTKVTFKKICTKRKNTLLPCPPSFKIWSYEITKAGSGTLYFLWCEKGVEQKGVHTEIGVIFPEELSISSLSFLKQFMDEQSAKEFGWE